MRAPLEWIKEFVNIDIAPKKLADALTMSGIEVSAIEYHGKEISDVIVGKIKGLERHPSKEDVHVCQIDTGEKIIQVVTKATNIKVGDKVPVALHGASLPGDIKVEKRELHGVESFGMLCSTVELGLSNEASGILILDKETALGEDIRKVIGVGGTVLEADILPNRADCLSVIGIAREISAVFDKPLKRTRTRVKESGGGAPKEITVSVKNGRSCPRYMARVIKGIKIKDSPKWMQDRLISCGMRPINNIVDITNYVLLETGQPLHAFDLQKIAGGELIVRDARKDEKIRTLDGEDRHLNTDTLVISDQKKALAIAGIIGGEDSSVTSNTKDILLESACFDTTAIHRAERTLKVRTESSIRFEKGVDWNQVEDALERAAKLVSEICGGSVLKGKFDIKNSKRTEKTLALRIARVNSMLGARISAKDVRNVLARLGFRVSEKNRDILNVVVPLFRSGDVEREIDLIEEVARIYGYDKIPQTLPKVIVSADDRDNRQNKYDDIAQLLLNNGLNEAMTYSMVGEDDIKKMNIGDDGTVKVTNAISPELSVMRPTLLPNLLKALRYNQSHQMRDIGLFETGKVFMKGPGDSVERTSLAIVATGRLLNDYEAKKDDADIYYLKNIVKEIFGLAGSGLAYTACKNSAAHPGRSIDVSINGKKIASFGELHPDLCSAYGLKGRVLFMEMDLDGLFELKGDVPRFREIAKYPAINRDIAMIVPNGVQNKAIIELIRETGGPLIEKIELFDRYAGGQIKKGFSGLAYSITYRDPKKTLNDDEVNKKQAEIVDKLEKTLRVEVRKQ